MDSLAVPLCCRVRARCCSKVHGHAYCGHCAAKQGKFFGWRYTRLVYAPDGVPMACVLLPAYYYERTLIHDLLCGLLLYGLPPGAYVHADKADNTAPGDESILAETGVRLVPRRKVNRAPNTGAEGLGLRAFRKTIKTVKSQVVASGLQRLRAHECGFDLKV